ncbi:MAG: hypothetical protein ALECFALPRED_005951 [Alectoria fallacina]|uniref:Major facilitator superfamily (MFS) profile domain-containing protein n=1 Tax=Alectoria fallacina TaxID=1903189 RepID=A0A8H3IZ69_9LECA|nr:MAG: hypothetical protein ALECFALPRED_005951 [Alectoria fallacina]
MAPGAVAVSYFLAQIVPVIPFALTTRVGVAEEDVQHWVSVLLAVYGAALLSASLCGYLADHTPSRRLPLLIGLFALLGSTLLLCLGRTLTLLIIGRLLQGLSAAIVWTVGLALLADTVGHDTIGQAMGYVSMSMSVAVLVAPLLGGVVYARAGYYSVFCMAFGLIVLDVVLRVVLVEKKIAKMWMPASQETSPPLPALEDEKPPGPSISSPPETTTLFALPRPDSVPPLTIFPTKRQLPPILTLLGSRRLLAALFCALIQSTLLTAWDAVLPLYVHRLFGWGSTGGGLIFLPLILPSFVAPLIGYWSDKRGPRIPTTLGFLLAVPFLVAMRAVNHGGIGQIVLLCALLACLGVALSMAMTPLLAEITYIINVKEKSHPGVFGRRGAYATAYGLFNTAFAGGMLVGPIWGGFVTQRSGWATMGWTLAILALVGAGVAALLIGGWVGRKGESGTKNVAIEERAHGQK